MSQWENQWIEFESIVKSRIGSFFDPAETIYSCRAPGRLDVMGGIADYSGSVVLEGTLGAGTCTALQLNQGSALEVTSLHSDFEEPQNCRVPTSAFFDGTQLKSYEDVHQLFSDLKDKAWAAYPLGCFYTLIASGWIDAQEVRGLKMLIASNIAIGSGISSSAALEVATMVAICKCFHIELTGVEIARLCQITENRVVGAPCGIMDQLTCAVGTENKLLVLACRPHDVLGHLEIPSHCQLVGVNSGVKHSVAGNPYAKARASAFMGLRITESIIGRNLQGYLCNLSPQEWDAISQRVPKELSGAEFIATYDSISDPISKIDPNAIYEIRKCAEHPIYENDRVKQFVALMELAKHDSDSNLMIEAGKLMIASHESYSNNVKLGSDESDLLVSMAMHLGPKNGIYGAKITGGGSGGTVAILCSSGESTLSLIRSMIKEYERDTGLSAELMTGSSPGATIFGTRQIAV